MTSTNSNLKCLDGISDELIHSLQFLQEFTVRLYFSDPLQVEVKEDRKMCLEKYSISSRHCHFIPDPSSSDFQAECWGRRTMVAREIANRYSRFFTARFASSKNVTAIAGSPLFRSFLASEHFFQPHFAIAHPYGMGAGYENVSKFFRWAIREENNFFVDDPEGRNMIYLDFAQFLLSMRKHSTEEFFAKIGKAVTHTDQLDPAFLIVVTPEKVIRVPWKTQHELFDLARLRLVN